MRPPLDRLVLGAVATLFAALSSRGDPSGFRSPSGGERLLSGSTLEVEWSRGEPGHPTETELVLSLDGGRTFPVRVSLEIEPDVTRIGWRVPSLATSHARLGLRTGSGSLESETIRLVSEEFEIVPDRDSLPEPFLRIDGEWRTRDSLILHDPELPAAGTIEPEPSLSARTNSDTVGDSPRTNPLETPDPRACEAVASVESNPDGTNSSPPRVRLAPMPLRE